MKKVIVSGCTGQDGSYMCEYLLENTDCEVLGGVRRTSQSILGNLKNCLSNKKFRIVPLELTDVHSVTSLIQKEKPDYFVHLGASSFVVDSWNQPAFTIEANSIALIHILEAIRMFSPLCRVYSAGSSEQWGDVKYSPQDEKHPMSPRSIYGVSKCASSHICKVYRESYHMYIVHGILTNHESPRRQSHFISRKITSGVARINYALKNKLSFAPIFCGNLLSRRDWSHSKDFVVGMWKMLNQEMYRTDWANRQDIDLPSEIKEYILSSNETHTVKTLIEKSFNAANIEGYWEGQGVNEKYILANYLLKDNDDIKSHILVEVDPQFFRPAEVDLLLGNSDLARKELGWKPEYTFDMLIEEMVKSDIENYKP